MSFGENLKALIHDRGLTQKKVAEDLNMAPSTMGSYVQNAREPDFETLKRLAAYFQVTTDYLLENNPDYIQSKQEAEMLRVFRQLQETEKPVCIEQAKVFIRIRTKE